MDNDVAAIDKATRQLLLDLEKILGAYDPASDLLTRLDNLSRQAFLTLNLTGLLVKKLDLLEQRMAANQQRDFDNQLKLFLN